MSAVGAIVVVVVVVVVVVGNRCTKKKIHLSKVSDTVNKNTSKNQTQTKTKKQLEKNYCFATTTKRIKNVKLPLLPEQ